MQERTITHHNPAQTNSPDADVFYWDIDTVSTCANEENLIGCHCPGRVVPRTRVLVREPGRYCAKKNTAPTPPEHSAMKTQRVSFCSSGNQKRVARMLRWNCGRRLARELWLTSVGIPPATSLGNPRLRGLHLR